jgi:hypothetical protein
VTFLALLVVVASPDDVRRCKGRDTSDVPGYCATKQRRLRTERRAYHPDAIALRLQLIDAFQKGFEWYVPRAVVLSRPTEPSDRLGQATLCGEHARTAGVDAPARTSKDKHAVPGRLFGDPPHTFRGT